MNNTDFELEIAHKFEAIKTVSGQVFWRIHIPKVDYKIYVAAQNIYARQLQLKNRHTTLPYKIIAWIIVFISTLYTLSYYSSGSKDAYIIYILVIISGLSLIHLGYKRAAYKFLHKINGNRACDLMLSEGGILVVVDNVIQLFPWKEIADRHKGESALYLIAENCAVIAIPELILGQQPDAEGMMAFIEQKLSGTYQA